MFVDETHLEVIGGRGGDGMASFRREKYVPRGGPNGGDGGRGGDVVFVATHNANTLERYRHKSRLRAEDGQRGGSKKKTGRAGADAVCRVPVGTLIWDAQTGEQLADLTEAGQRFVAAEGGAGGLGNVHFKTSRRRAPRKSTPGKPGQARRLRLELKLLADVGLVGFPSVGKSTLIGAISNARPQVAAYPFTTLSPYLGVVRWRELREFIVADIPGLIEGAHEGQGLGHRFLRHVERTNLLVHVLEVTAKLEEGPDDGRDPIRDYEVLCRELERFEPELLERPQMVVLNKIDLERTRERAEEVRAHFEEELGLEYAEVSATARLGLDELVERLGRAVLERTDQGSRPLEWWERDEGAPPRVSAPTHQQEE